MLLCLGISLDMRGILLDIKDTAAEGRNQEKKTMETPSSSIKWVELIACGDATVEVCTVCGIDYEGVRIPGETPAQCKARHDAAVAAIESLCGGGSR